MNVIERRVAGFARLYAPMFLIGVMLTFTPYYEDVDGTRYRTLWEIVEKAPSAGVAFLTGTVLLIGFLAWGVFGPGQIGAPIGIGVTSLVMLVVMVAKIGAASHAVWSDAGQSVIVLSAVGLIASIAHILVLLVSRSSVANVPMPPPYQHVYH